MTCPSAFSYVSLILVFSNFSCITTDPSNVLSLLQGIRLVAGVEVFLFCRDPKVLNPLNCYKEIVKYSKIVQQPLSSSSKLVSTKWSRLLSFILHDLRQLHLLTYIFLGHSRFSLVILLFS